MSNKVEDSYTTVKKFNNRKKEWVDVKLKPAKEKFQPKKTRSSFDIGDLIEDNMKEGNFGIALITRKEKVRGYHLVYKNGKTTKVYYTDWKYLLFFSDKNTKSISRVGELWVWETPLIELLNEKSLLLHKSKKRS